MNLLKSIRLPDGRETSTLGFGCAGLLRLPTGRSRERLLRTALDEGITHFDAARMYGMGTAEGIVASALGAERGRVTIGTKFGLPYEPASGVGLRIQSLGRWALSKAPGLKSTVRSLLARPPAPPAAATPAAASQSVPPPPASTRVYSVAGMRESLGLSLQALKSDRVDLLFLHAPGFHDCVDPEMEAALQSLQDAGKAGAFGISTYRAEMDHFLASRPGLCREALQYHHSILSARPPIPGPCFRSMFGVLEGSLQRVAAVLAADEGLRREWSDKLGLDLASVENVGILLLAAALCANPSGMVLFFTSNPKRLKTVALGLQTNSFTAENLADFQNLFSRKLHAH